MIRIKGKIVRGWGRASIAIAIQKKLFAQSIPTIGRCFNGTINMIAEENPIPLFKSHIMFLNLKWKPNRWETFILYPVRVIIGRQSKRGWIYRPFGSSHFREKNYIEVISPKFNIGNHRILTLEIFEQPHE